MNAHPAQHIFHTALISAAQLKRLTASGQPVMVFDCSFDLMDPQAGEAMYLEAHIPGAVYAHLDTALSDKSSDKSSQLAAAAQLPHTERPDSERPASGGRHPLPAREKFAAWLGSVGFSNDASASPPRPCAVRPKKVRRVSRWARNCRSSGCGFIADVKNQTPNTKLQQTHKHQF